MVSATREGRKLVAVVLGEPSTASRRVRATDLLENGFKRYFWKSLFGTSLDGLAIQASLSDGPTHLKDSVCGGGQAQARRKRAVTRKAKPKIASPSHAASDPAGAVNATTDAAALSPRAP